MTCHTDAERFSIETRSVCPHLIVLASTLARSVLADNPVIPDCSPSVVLNMVVTYLASVLVNDFLALEVIRTSGVDDNILDAPHMPPNRFISVCSGETRSGLNALAT